MAELVGRQLGEVVGEARLADHEITGSGLALELLGPEPGDQRDGGRDGAEHDRPGREDRADEQDRRSRARR